ncbi:MAG: phenylacetone monooxygenase [Pseudomonadota bacterium]|jgi:cyclohexanone monooxygenase
MPKETPSPDCVDAVVVGAGFSGLYMLHRLRQAGFTTRAFERGGDVGGTWYWNRYPGARCDVESMQYSYSFDDALQQQWHWPEKYAAQPDILAYLNHVADRFALRPLIDFGVSVTAAHFDEATSRWTVTTDAGENVSTRFLVMATGCLSTPQVPDLPGEADFTGPIYRTGLWPHEPVDFTSQRIAVIGTGSSGIQAIPELARQAAHVTVFQRTPHYTVPARNCPMTPEYERAWKENYAARRAEMRTTQSGSLRSGPSLDAAAFSVEDASRQAMFDAAWEAGGMSILKTFNDLLTDRAANDTAAEFARQRIRDIVRDADTARLLEPTSYPIGTKRLCLDTGYYETYNRDNVDLVDISGSGIDRLTADGLVAGGRAYAFDAIVFATGFDAMTGTLLRIDIRGRAGLTLQEKWQHGPRSYLGLMVAGFPNLFTITGPGSPSVKGNMMTSIEQHVDLVADTLAHLRSNNLALIEPEREAEDAWVATVQAEAARTLFPEANSWYMGANVPGKPRLFMPYIGGTGTYRKICNDIVADGYRGFRFYSPPM